MVGRLLIGPHCAGSQSNLVSLAPCSLLIVCQLEETARARNGGLKAPDVAEDLVVPSDYGWAICLSVLSVLPSLLCAVLLLLAFVFCWARRSCVFGRLA